MSIYNNSYEIYTESQNGEIGRTKGTNRSKLIEDLKNDIEYINMLIEDGEISSDNVIISASLHDYKHGRNKKWNIVNGKLAEVKTDL